MRRWRKSTTTVSALCTRGHLRRRPGCGLDRLLFASKDLPVGHNGMPVWIRGLRSPVNASRQQVGGFPDQGGDGQPGGRDLARVARRSVTVVEVDRSVTFSPMGLVFLRAWSYLRFVIQQVKNPRWAAVGTGAHARNVPAVRSRRQKLWPRCSSPGCDRPVPPDAVHDLCGRAGPYVALIRAPRHGGPCCPGTCPGCRACLDTPRVKTGWCVRCGVCAVCCRGHDVLTSPTIRDYGQLRGNVNEPRTREGMVIAQRKAAYAASIPTQRCASPPSVRGGVSLADLAEEYNVGLSTIYRVIHHTQPDPLTPLSIPSWLDPRPQAQSWPDL